MTKEVCSGISPWKCDAKTAHIALSLVAKGIDIAGLSQEALQTKYDEMQNEPASEEQEPKFIQELRESGYIFGEYHAEDHNGI